MTCNGCPQIPDTPPDAAGEVYIIYTGGREHANLSKLVRAMPPEDGQLRTFPRPIFHPDGSIEYEKRRGDWEPPRPIDGYEPERENPWRFHPLWQYCEHRIFGVRFYTVCGCIDVLAVCNSPESDQRGKFVTYDQCKACRVTKSE